MTTAAGIGGLVLAGGRGTRMGGVDKGLVAWRGGTLASNAAARLAPQVARVAISANRNLDRYAVSGLPVLEDARSSGQAGPAFDGPLAGVLAACDPDGPFADLPWLAVVPCDVPFIPDDLVARLAAACAGGAGAAAHAVSPDPETGLPRDQPLCCLLMRQERDALRAYLDSGRRSARGFLASVGALAVPFLEARDDPRAFVNVNVPGTLDAWKGPTRQTAADSPAPPPTPNR